ncbi:MAG TPA: family 16 glycoside hydrolase [Candidatus Eisenbacteria bacterium]|nr:family 16 glycoside hydrolase [Candidatus Eisenbacteria bacterium]
MRPILCAALIAALAPAAAWAQIYPPPARPVTGRILFHDDFTDSSLARWRPDQDGVWRVVHGMLRGSLPDKRQKHSLIEAGDDAWTDIALDVDLLQTRGVDKGVVLRAGKKKGVGVDLRGTGYDDVRVMHREWPVAHAPVNVPNGKWHHLRVEARGQEFRVLVDDRLVVDATDRHKGAERGHIALAAYTGGIGECEVWYAHVRVTALPAPTASAGSPRPRPNRAPPRRGHSAADAGAAAMR